MRRFCGKLFSEFSVGYNCSFDILIDGNVRIDRIKEGDVEDCAECLTDVFIYGCMDPLIGNAPAKISKKKLMNSFADGLYQTLERDLKVQSFFAKDEESEKVVGVVRNDNLYISSFPEDFWDDLMNVSFEEACEKLETIFTHENLLTWNLEDIPDILAGLLGDEEFQQVGIWYLEKWKVMTREFVRRKELPENICELSVIAVEREYRRKGYYHMNVSNHLLNETLDDARENGYGSVISTADNVVSRNMMYRESPEDKIDVETLGSFRTEDLVIGGEKIYDGLEAKLSNLAHYNFDKVYKDRISDSYIVRFSFK